MASLYKRANSKYIWIKYYDKMLKKTFYHSTKYMDTKEGWRKAKDLLKEVNAGIVLGYKTSDHNSTSGITKSIKDAYKHFELQLSNKSKTTQDEYQRFYNRFITYFPENLSVNIIQKMEVEKFLLSVQLLPKLQPNTKHGIYKNTKRFLNFLFEYDYIPLFTINKDYYIKSEVKAIITFSHEDLKKILNLLPSKNNNLQTMIYLLLYTGLRPSDIINIKINDIDFHHNTLKYYSPKGDEWRVVSINTELTPILKKRIAEIDHDRLLEYSSIKNMGKAFSRFRKEMHTQSELALGKTLKQIKEENNYPHYNLRTFRKSFISMAYDMGLDLAIVSDLVGHHNIGTTQTYYNKISLSRQALAVSKISLANLGTDSGDSKTNEKNKAL